MGYNETTGEVLEGESNRPNWIRLERSYGKGSENTDSDLFCDGTGELGKSSAGKRKYFTYGLVSGLQANGTTTESNNISANTSVTIPLTELNTNSTNPTDPNPNGCVWIYADECLDYTTSGSTDNVRSALIRVTCGSEVIDYVVNQHKLFKIDYTGEDGVTHSYYIEQEEEYLYNFDADDNFTQNQTFDEGMKWGLDGAQLSFDVDALAFNTGGGLVGGIVGAFVNYFTDQVSNFQYDFYLKRDDAPVSDNDKRDNAGYDFTTEIINDINNNSRNTNTNYTIGALALDKKPRCAIEYCYNRNKRNANGLVENVNWYMPSIDELEDIMKTAYSDFLVFQDKFYWSSQPAYKRNFAHYYSALLADYEGVYYTDNVNRARATKVIYSSGTYADPISSGVDGYYHVFAYYKPAIGNESITQDTDIEGGKSYTYTYRGGPKTVNGYNLTNHPGNKPRTAECRVRAVRRMPATTN